MLSRLTLIFKLAIGNLMSRYGGLFSFFMFHKAFAAFSSLQLSQSHGFGILQVQSDCQQVVCLVNDPATSTSPLSLARSIARIRNRGWMMEVLWVPKEENKTADELTKIAYARDHLTVTLDVLSVEILHLLDRDRMRL
ncbi:hypothetical protein V6N11_040377 [Hibiscus sabdariffa]|uniref:RNase H type-1 domain-containing protein n=1 Tax=Hibiscus sabdariffa TaxID=183260 RepID=A0ABR2RHD9_9ROSI